MNIPSNLAKSCLLATSVFWIVIISEDFEANMLPFVFLSLIPIFLCVTIVIMLTICPFFWWKNQANFNNRQVFKTYFPYHAIMAFVICVLGIMASDFDIYLIAFFSSAFITINQSWLWFAKEEKQQKQQHENA